MTIENITSTFIGVLNSQPISMLTAGEGAPAVLRRLTDTVQPTASGLGSIGSTYRLCRFPTSAKVKRVILDLGGVDTNVAATAKFDVNVAFSDSLFDGTSPAFTPNNGLTEATALCIPTTALTGAVTSITAYSAPNLIFGQVTASNSGVAKNNQDVTWNGSLAGWAYNGINLPMWDFLGFVNSQGSAQDPAGYFDILLRLTTAAATPASAPINVQVDFVY